MGAISVNEFEIGLLCSSNFVRGFGSCSCEALGSMVGIPFESTTFLSYLLFAYSS